MYNHNKAQQSKNRVHLSWDILYTAILHGTNISHLMITHDDVSKWRHFPRYWPFVRGIHRSTVNPPDKGQWRGALMFSLICAWITGLENNREAGDYRRIRAHYDVIVMNIPQTLDSIIIAVSVMVSTRC